MNFLTNQLWAVSRTGKVLNRIPQNQKWWNFLTVENTKSQRCEDVSNHQVINKILVSFSIGLRDDVTIVTKFLLESFGGTMGIPSAQCRSHFIMSQALSSIDQRLAFYSKWIFRSVSKISSWVKKKVEKESYKKYFKKNICTKSALQK